MAVTPNLNLPLLDSEEKVSEDHLKINQFVEALDARLGEFATTVAGLATAGHSHDMAKISGLADALELLAARDHSHKLDELADVDVTEAPDGKILQKIAGKWGLGERSYSVSEINSLFQTQKHPLSDIVGLEDLLAKFANTTKNTKFEKGLSVTNGDLYLNNKSIIANDENGEFAERTGSNIDSIRHDDAANAWHFISDGRINERGNANLLARRVDLIDDNINLTSSHQWLNRALCLSKHTHAIDENRSSSVSLFENRQYPPSNADAEKRFYKRGLFAIADEEAPAGSGLTYELKGVEGLARLKGGASVHAMIGGTSYSGTYEDSTGSVEYLYGHRAGAWVNGSGRVENLRGVYTSVNPNHDQAIIKNVLGTAIHMDYDGGTIETKPIALHINFDGDWDGQERIGIAQYQVQSNYLTGKTYIEGQEVLHEGNSEAAISKIAFTTPRKISRVYRSAQDITLDLEADSNYEVWVIGGGGGNETDRSGQGGAGGVSTIYLDRDTYKGKTFSAIVGAGGNSSSSSSSVHGGGASSFVGHGVNVQATGGGEGHGSNAYSGEGTGGHVNVPRSRRFNNGGTPSSSYGQAGLSGDGQAGAIVVNYYYNRYAPPTPAENYYQVP
ncbi:glycine-rich domain-containing protein [Pseudovibrio brasiliensis]|uniref:Glycine-rich domain-containing protein n=1 Tax=Pseudovibrio brasiliensis TaxID=1898042 RepID=A0ABX8AZE3_9HYPH|nr:hypothetical protein [Pseudovibrio brasiliensis]QUS59215.1 hypothetical protein KGB56_26900 [Pseudovibrio brasiliensis]